MTSLTLATVLQLSLSAAAAADSYADAHRVTTETGKPMVVMVSTEWCPPCQRMKKTVIPEVRKLAIFKEVSFAVVNPDDDGSLANSLTGGGPVPQLVMFRLTPDGWRRRKLVGAQSLGTVKLFLEKGVAATKQDSKASLADEDSSTETAAKVVPVSARQSK